MTAGDLRAQDMSKTGAQELSTSAQLRQTQEELKRTLALLGELERSFTASHRITAEQLQQTQQALAASQADLSRAIDERDQFVAAADRLSGQWLDLKAQLLGLAADLTRVHRELNAAHETNRELAALWESASAQIARAEAERDEAQAAHRRISDRLTETVVRLAACCGGRDLARAELSSARQELERLRSQTCDRCGQPIWIAEIVQHAACPTQDPPDLQEKPDA